jgi:hypothetical protein
VENTQRTLWQEALAAIRFNFAPGVFLWFAASAVVALYYLAEPARPFFTALADLKSQGGFVFSVVATAVFAGLIPVAFLAARRATRAQVTWGTVVFLVVFWGYRGLEVDVFYRFQAWMFGAQATAGTVAAKVLFDMFVYNVVWAASLQMLAYHWMNAGYRFSTFRGFDWSHYFRRTLPVALLSTWTVWIPVVTLVYSLPGNLQIPLFNLASCFWSLVVASLTTRTAAAKRP